MMNSSTDIGIALSWQASSIAWLQDEHSMTTLDIASEQILALPELPDANMHVQQVYLPMEHLLSRAVQFPFASPALVDADMLFQALSDDVDAKADDWWLAWHLEACQTGVAGMVFGLPNSLRTAMQAQTHWGQVNHIMVDGFERLQRHRVPEQAAGIMDQDDEGLFFGFFDAQAWRGMCRFNGSSTTDSASFQILKSLQAMGFDAKQHVLLGIADERTWQIWRNKGCDVQGEGVNMLSNRHAANLAIQAKTTRPLNFRHGRWSAKLAWQRVEFWQRSIMMLLALACVWYIGTWYQIRQIDDALAASQQRIEAAFHHALPNEHVMLDALAQLQQAAGGTKSMQSTFLSDLEAVGHVYQQQAWQLDTLVLRDGKMQMDGSVQAITQLNHIQELLQKTLHKEVNIVDTHMANQHVSFQLSW